MEAVKINQSRGVIERFREFLPPCETVISLGEGNTPLVFSPKLSERVGCEVFIKNEGVNPTGSFKDRGMTVAVSRAIDRGARALLCASTGNTSASAAAYAARGGVRCAVVLPAGKIATGKIACGLARRQPGWLYFRSTYETAPADFRRLGCAIMSVAASA